MLQIERVVEMGTDVSLLAFDGVFGIVKLEAEALRRKTQKASPRVSVACAGADQCCPEGHARMLSSLPSPRRKRAGQRLVNALDALLNFCDRQNAIDPACMRIVHRRRPSAAVAEGRGARRVLDYALAAPAVPAQPWSPGGRIAT